MRLIPVSKVTSHAMNLLGISLKSPEAQAYIASFYREAGRLAELPPRAELAKMAFHDLGWYEFLLVRLARREEKG